MCIWEHLMWNSVGFSCWHRQCDSKWKQLCIQLPSPVLIASLHICLEKMHQEKGEAWVHTHPGIMQCRRSSLPLPLPGGGLYPGVKTESPTTQSKFYTLNLVDILKAIPFYLWVKKFESEQIRKLSLVLGNTKKLFFSLLMNILKFKLNW